MRTIRSGVLTLEPQTIAHATEMFAVLSDPAIYEYENQPPASLEWLRARFAKLETRQSPDGTEQWLNWVIRLQGSTLIGFVQATIRPNREVGIAYVLSSAHWRRGLAREAVDAMITELANHYQVKKLTAVLKRENFRSMRLLERLGFHPAASLEPNALEPDEVLMRRDL